MMTIPSAPSIGGKCPINECGSVHAVNTIDGRVYTWRCVIGTGVERKFTSHTGKVSAPPIIDEPVTSASPPPRFIISEAKLAELGNPSGGLWITSRPQDVGDGYIQVAWPSPVSVIEAYTQQQREGARMSPSCMAEASREWAAQLRAKVDASRAADAEAKRYTPYWGPEED